MNDDTPKKKKRPRDFNQLAAVIVGEAVGDIEPEESVDLKSPAAVALGRLGGKRGGRARAEKLTAEQRKEIARKAANTRWGNL
jgi:hypothetical protein